MPDQIPPRSPHCFRCGSRRIGKIWGPGNSRETTFLILLLLCGIFPGISYFFYLHFLPYCPSCNRRQRLGETGPHE